MEELYYWYVLYVRSNTEHKVAGNFQKAFSEKGLPYELEAFCPESEQFYKDKHSRTLTLGKVYRKRPLFPGYVFVETNMPEEEFRAAAYDVIYHSTYIIRLLQNGKDGSIAIGQDERQRLEYLLKSKRCLEHSVGYIEGDKITITGGPLIGMEGQIKKINRHHRTAQIEIDMFERKQIVEAALEIVIKKD